MKTPCKGCNRREIGCHAKCGDYAEFKVERAKLNERRKQAVEEQDTVIRELERMLNTRSRK